MTGWRAYMPRKKDPRPKWKNRPQMRAGMITRYQNSRYNLAHRQEFSIGDGLLDWVEGFGPFMKGKTK